MVWQCTTFTARIHAFIVLLAVNTSLSVMDHGCINIRNENVAIKLDTSDYVQQLNNLMEKHVAPKKLIFFPFFLTLYNRYNLAVSFIAFM